MEPSESKDQPESILKKKINRRELLRIAGVGSIGLMLGGAGIGGILSTRTKVESGEASIPTTLDSIPFHGKHQAGIITPAQNFICCAAFDVTTNDINEVRQLFQAWTEAAITMTQGSLIGSNNNNQNLPPSDTGEAAGLSPSRSTITFGVGPSFFDSRFGLQSKRPSTFQDLPSFRGDHLQPQWCGGDLVVQVCADDMQVAFHAIRNLTRIARGKAVLRWTQDGFQRTTQADPAAGTPRNLLGFKDGTGNPKVSDPDLMNQVVWAQNTDGAAWMTGGSYMVVRRVRMLIEVWDRSSLKDQETTFGRYRDSGAPMGAHHELDPVDVHATTPEGDLQIPANSHVALSHGDGTLKLLRRSYSYSSGIDSTRGQLDAGLLFISYQRDLYKQFVPIQQKLAAGDKLNEYISNIGSAVFACFPGVEQGRYIGDSLL